MARKIEDRIATAQTAFEAGFASKAAQKRALDELNRAYETIRNSVHDKVRDIAWGENAEKDAEGFDARRAIFDNYDLPFELHQVRDRHFVAVAVFEEFAIVRDLIALRNAIKAAAIIEVSAKPEIEVKADAVRRTIVEEMERRKAMFISGMELGRMMGELFPDRKGAKALPITVNAHWVRGHKGTDFVRYFFYLNAKLTPLNIIMGVAQALEAEVA